MRRNDGQDHLSGRLELSSILHEVFPVNRSQDAFALFNTTNGPRHEKDKMICFCPPLSAYCIGLWETMCSLYKNPFWFIGGQSLCRIV